MICKICTSNAYLAFTAKILRKYSAEFFCCQKCGFLFANDPHWLEEAYSSAITDADTGLVARNVDIARRLASVLYLCTPDPELGRYVDIAGGYGMLTRLMRDVGFDFYWFDRYCENVLAKGFEFSNELRGCRAVTAMEVMEHVSDPMGFIEESLSFAGADTLIFTTELFDGAPPSPGAWWYYTFETGQHISFYQTRSLESIASRMGLKFASARGIHILSRERVNEPLLRFSTHSVVSRLGEIWIRRRLGSKTVADHNLMLSRSLNADSARS
jgi:hypothetical protein